MIADEFPGAACLISLKLGKSTFPVKRGNEYEAVRGHIGQRAKEERIYDAADSGVRTNAECQRTKHAQVKGGLPRSCRMAWRRSLRNDIA